MVKYRFRGHHSVFTQQSFADARCDDPNCDNPDCVTLFLHPRCHDEGLWVQYRKTTGHLTITCRACDEEVATFLVAKGAA